MHPALLSPVCVWLIITPVALIYHIFIRLSKIVMNVCLGPVHTYPEIFVSANFFMRIHLASTRVRRIRSVYPEISVYALQSGNFCIAVYPDTCGRSYPYIFVYADVMRMLC